METIHYILEVFRHYESYFMILLTSGYFLATILIFKENKKAADNLSKQIELQKEQWIYDESRREETRILLKYYKMLVNAGDTIFWFQKDYAHPFNEPIHNIQHNSLGETDEDRHRIHAQHQSVLNNLNNYMNKHLIIFEKNNLAYNAQYLWCFLNTPKPGPIIIQTKNNEDVFEFRNIFEIRWSIIREAHRIMHCVTHFKSYTQDEMNILVAQHYTLFHNNIDNGLRELQKDLEKLLFRVTPDEIETKQKIGLRTFYLEPNAKIVQSYRT